MWLAVQVCGVLRCRDLDTHVDTERKQKIYIIAQGSSCYRCGLRVPLVREATPSSDV